MIKFLKFITPIILNILLNIILLLVGVSLLIFPQYGIELLQYIFVGVLFIKSFIEFWAYFIQRDMQSKSRLYQGLLFLVLGITVLVNNSFRIISLSVLLSIIFLIDAILKFLVAFQYKVSGLKSWWYTFLAGCVSFFLILTLYTKGITYNILINIAGIFIIWQAATAIFDIIFRGQRWQDIKEHWKFNVLYIHQNAYDNSFLPARWFSKIEESLTEKNDKTNFLAKDNTVKLVPMDGYQTIKVTIHSWNGDVMTMKGHSDFIVDNYCYSYGNYDASSSKLGGNLSEGVLVISPEQPYIDYCLQQEKKVLVQYTLRISNLQRQKLNEVLTKLKGNLIEWFPPYVKDKTADDDASKLYCKLGSIDEKIVPRFYKFKAGQFKYYFVINTNCIRFVESILAAIDFMDIKYSGLITPGDYINFFEKKLANPHDYDIIERQVLVDLNNQ